MIIPGIILILLAIVGGLVVFLIGLLGWFILKLMKEELHLDITTNENDPEIKSSQE